MSSSNVNKPLETSKSCFSASDNESSNEDSYKLAARSQMLRRIAMNVSVDPTLEDTASKGNLDAGPSNLNLSPKIAIVGESQVAPIDIQSESVGGIHESIGQAQQSQSANPDVSISYGPDSSKMMVPAGKRIAIKRNNCSLNFKSTDFVAEQQIIIEILKKHPFKTMLSRKFLVPEEYLQQWWCYSEIEDNEEELCSYVAGYRFEVKVSDVRKMLNLPSETDVVGKSSYDPIPKNSELISDFLKLGYNEELTTLSSFRRKCLPPVWYTLFSIINTCLSGKNSSLDQASTNIRIVFHGIAHNKHYDYARLLFEEMRTAIFKKSTFSYIPFQRFFQMFIKAAMKSVDGIPSLESAPHVHLFTMDNLRPPSAKQVFTFSSPLPKELLAYVNHRNEVLVSYLESLNPQEPADSSPDSTQRSVERVPSSHRESGDDAEVGEHHQTEERKFKRLRKGSKKLKKRIDEGSSQDKVLTSCDPNDTIRAPTSSNDPHPLEDIIETAYEPKAKLANLQVHSSVSEKADVSITLMEQPTHKPVGPHLVEPIVETGGNMSPLPSFVHIESFEPNRSQDDLIIDTCTSPKDFTKQSVSHFVSTTIGDPELDIQGLVGSPGGANIIKTPLKESFVDSGVVAPTGQAASDAVLKTNPSVGFENITPSSEFMQFKDFCSLEFEKIHRNIHDLTAKSYSEVEARVEKVMGEMNSDSVKKSDLAGFQEVILKSFSEVSQTISSLKVGMSLSEESLATKGDVKLILDQLSSVQNYQVNLDERLKALESQSISLKRKQVEQVEDDAPLEGENKRRRISEDKMEVDIVEKISEPVISEPVVKEVESVEDDQMVISEEGMEVDESGYETEKISIDYDYEEDKISEVHLDSNEEMLYEYLAQEEEIGEPCDLSDVIVFEEVVPEIENLNREIVLWKPSVIRSEVERSEVVEENLHREIVLWKSDVVNSEVVVSSEAAQKWFSVLKETIIQRHGFLNPILKRISFDERLEVFKDFVNKEAKESWTFNHMNHLSDDYEGVDYEFWFEFDENICVMFKEPIVIPKIQFNLLKSPVIDKVFFKDMIDGVQEDIRFPEGVNSLMYRTSLKDITLESFFNDKWSNEYCDKVKEFLSSHGHFEVQNPVLIQRILKVSVEEKDGLQVKMIGAQRRDGTLVEFSEFEIYYLRLQDKLTLLNYSVKNEDIDLGKEIKRVLGIYIRNITCHDFQLALENKLEKVNLLEPIFISFENLTEGIFIIPELGFIYRMNKYCCKTFLISDIPKYSDSTLNWFLDYLKIHKLGPQKYCDEIVFLIKERIQFREFVRRVFCIAYSEVNLLREADYLLRCTYDFEVHGRKQIVQYEKPEVDAAVKGKLKKKMPEDASSEAVAKEISVVKETEIITKGKEKASEVEMKSTDQKVISEEEHSTQKRIEEHALTLFLEYFHPEIFMDTEQRFNFIDCWINKSSGWKLWYSRMMDDLRQPVHKVRKDVPIKKVISADLKSKRNFKYSSFTVERMNGDKCMFTEADFQNMHIRDLVKVYNSMNPFHDKVAKFRRTFPTLRDGIYRLFIWAAKTDFQVAYILKKEKVHLSKPNFFLDGVERVSKGILIVHPPGFVCKLQDQKLFVRYEEIHKCCNGTLIAIFERLMRRQTRKPRKMKDEDWAEYTNLAKNFCERIESLIEYRRIILSDVMHILIEWKYDLSF